MSVFIVESGGVQFIVRPEGAPAIQIPLTRAGASKNGNLNGEGYITEFGIN